MILRLILCVFGVCFLCVFLCAILGLLLRPIQMTKNTSVSVELKALFRNFTDTNDKDRFCIGRIEGSVSVFHRYNCKETVLYRYSFDSEIKKLPIQKQKMTMYRLVLRSLC